MSYHLGSIESGSETQKIQKLSSAVKEMLRKPPNVIHLSRPNGYKSQNSALAVQNAEMRSRISQLEQLLQEERRKYDQEKLDWSRREIHLEQDIALFRVMSVILCLALISKKF